MQHDVSKHQYIHLRSHETSVRIIGAAYDRLITNVEACIDQDGASCERLERLQQSIELRVAVRADGLDTSRIIDVGNCRNVAAHLI